MLYAGKGVEKDFDATVLWTRKGVAAGDPRAKTNLGEMYEYGRGVPRDMKLAAKWYREAAAKGVKDAQDGLARIAAMGATPDVAAQQSPAVERVNQALKSGDVDSGVRILADLANAGDFDAQISLGFIYVGVPVVLVPRDFEKARFWMQKAVAQKNRAAAIALDDTLMEVAVKIRHGALANVDIVSLFGGVQPDPDDAKDYLEAVKWFKMAAALGNTDAMIVIGDLYERDLYGEDGHGLDRDYAAAFKYYKRADAIKATPLVAFRIGRHYARGLGVSRNDTTAAQWFRKAADEYSGAELWLANYEIGKNNLRPAMYWLDRLYLNQESNKLLSSKYDKILHLYYAASLPPAPSGWTAQSIEHQTTKEPVKHASLSSSDVIYPIIFQRRYRQSATGREYIVRVLLSNYEHAEKIKTEVAQARRYSEDARRRMESNDTKVARSILEAGANMYVRFGAYGGFNTTIRSDGPNEALIQVPLNAHIVVRAETLNGDADKPEDVEILKTALRATKFDLIESAAGGHGYYKKDSNGKIYNHENPCSRMYQAYDAYWSGRRISFVLHFATASEPRNRYPCGMVKCSYSRPVSRADGGVDYRRAGAGRSGNDYIRF